MTRNSHFLQTLLKGPEGVVSYSIDVYLVDCLLPIDVELPVGIDVDAHLPNVGVDEPGRVPLLQVGQEFLH